MLRNIKDFTGFTLTATDGEVGEVKDFFFDDQTWTVRYLVVETGSWLSGRRVLISTESMDHHHIESTIENRSFPVNLTKEQIIHSPDIDTDSPISRQHEEQLNGHYPGWNNYWQSGYFTTGMLAYNALPLEDEIRIRDEENHSYRDEHETHLRSTHQLKGDTLKAADGDIGEIDGFIIDDTTWKVQYIIADIGGWFKDRKVLIAPRSISTVDWAMSTVTTDLSIDAVKNSPAYNEDDPRYEEADTHFGSYYSQR